MVYVFENQGVVNKLDCVCVCVCVNIFKEKKPGEKNQEQPPKQLEMTEPGTMAGTHLKRGPQTPVWLNAEKHNASSNSLKVRFHASKIRMCSP